MTTRWGMTMFWAVLAAGVAGVALAAEPPRLTVVLVIDQLRSDLPERAATGFARDDGFRELWSDGVIFDQTYYEHAATSTAPGHATIFTGAHPSQHGIIENQWFDRQSGRVTAAIRAAAYGREPGPYNLLATTIGDQLRLDCGAECKVFGVSAKDRGAILPAGKLGKAFWFDNRNGGFRSGRYYYDTGVPHWVEAWNEAHHDYPTTWTLSRPRADYRFTDVDDRPFERPPAPLGRTFPHSLGARDDKGFLTAFRHTPFLDAMTVEFAEALIEAEKLGADAKPDLLSLSLSATDYIGHAFGPHSLEAEDNLLRLDRDIAGLITYLDRRIGRERYLLVLTADHGVAAMPEYSASLGLATQRIDVNALQAKLDAALASALGIDGKTVLALTPPSVYLDREAIAANGIELERAAQVAAGILAQEPGIAEAFPIDELPRNDPDLAAAVAVSIVPARSGDVYVIPEPGSALVQGLDLYSAFHGTPYADDRYVPLYFFGAGLKPAHVGRRVSPRAIAPTLAELLGVAPPSHADAPALPEVLEGREPVEANGN